MSEQQEQTFRIFADLNGRRNLPEFAVVDFQFIPAGIRADWDGFEAEVTGLGYQSQRYRTGDTLEISSPSIKLSAEGIWEREKILADIAKRFDFEPDGWGFWEN